MDIRRATSDDLGQIAPLLDAAELPPLPGNLPLANVLVALRDAVVIGVVAMEVRGLNTTARATPIATRAPRDKWDNKFPPGSRAPA